MSLILEIKSEPISLRRDLSEILSGKQMYHFSKPFYSRLICNVLVNIAYYVHIVRSQHANYPRILLNQMTRRLQLKNTKKEIELLYRL